MGWFEKPAAPPQFTSRAEAFAYMLSRRMADGSDPMAAAREAGEFADIYASNMGLPATPEKPVEGLDKYMADLDKIAGYCDQHPKMVDLLLGAVSFIGGVLTAKGIDQHRLQAAPPQQPQQPAAPIDFDNVN